MKQVLSRIIKTVKRHRNVIDVQSTHTTVWRDWYVMLGGVVIALVAYFSVGAYIFLVTIQHTETNANGVQVYQPPIDKDTMLRTATTLRERTGLFVSLRSSSPWTPTLGTAVSEKKNTGSGEVDDEMSEEADGRVLPE